MVFPLQDSGCGNPLPFLGLAARNMVISESVVGSSVRKSALAALAVPECNRVVFTDPGWHFDCGLIVSDRLVADGVVEWELLSRAHEAHHEHEPRDFWNLVSEVTRTDTTVTYRVYCDCVH